MTDFNAPAPARNPAIFLALICLPVFIGALDLTIVSAVLPNVIVDLQIPFQSGADEAAWVMSGYLLAYTVSITIMGRVSDLLGRRRTFFLALLIFILGSWWVAAATFVPAGWMRTVFRLIEGGRPDRAYMALYSLIAGRVIQAFGAGAMVPISMALVGDLYPPARRATAIGVVGAVDTAGWVLGHLYGGLMVQIVDWPVLFWLNIPITTAIAALTWRRLAPLAEARGEGGAPRATWAVIIAGLAVVNLLALLEILHAPFPNFLAALTRQLLTLRWLSLGIVLLTLAAIILMLVARQHTPESNGRVDWAGAGLIAATLIALTVGLGGHTEPGLTAELGTPASIKVVPLVAAGLLFAAFLLWERNSAAQLFPLRYFRTRNVSLAVVTNLVIGFCLMVGLVSIPLFINTVVAASLEEAALVSGILLGALTVPMALASVPGGMLAERFGYRLPTVLGLALAAVGFFLGRTWVPDIPRTTMGLHMALAGIGLGLTIAPISTTVINAVRADERGTASALVLVMRLIGMTVGTAIMTGYGLRRLTLLINVGRAVLSYTPTVQDLFDIGIRAATRVINEMLVIAAVVCAAAILVAIWLRPHDTLTPR